MQSLRLADRDQLDLLGAIAAFEVHEHPTLLAERHRLVTRGVYRDGAVRAAAWPERRGVAVGNRVAERVEVRLQLRPIRAAVRRKHQVGTEDGIRRTAGVVVDEEALGPVAERRPGRRPPDLA